MNPFDQSQVAIITTAVTDSIATISWTPAGAYRIRIYEGSYDGDDGYNGVVWSATAEDFSNVLVSPYVAGSDPGIESGNPVLLPGQNYTVTVRRRDPKGTGDGFTNTSKVYIGELAFIP